MLLVSMTSVSETWSLSCSLPIGEHAMRETSRSPSKALTTMTSRGMEP